MAGVAGSAGVAGVSGAWRVAAGGKTRDHGLFIVCDLLLIKKLRKCKAVGRSALHRLRRLSGAGQLKCGSSVWHI